MSVSCVANGESYVLLTGAPDVLLTLCQQQQTPEGAEPIDVYRLCTLRCLLLLTQRQQHVWRTGQQHIRFAVGNTADRHIF